MTNGLIYAIIGGMKTLATVYGQHAEVPTVPEQYLEEILDKPIAKRQMERTVDGFLPGHVIMLWRVQFGSYLTTSPHHKYFATTYGIDASKELDWLITQGYVTLEGPSQALRHVPSQKLKNWLKEAGVKGLSKMKRADLDAQVLALWSEEELGQRFEERAYLLTEQGQSVLDRYPEIVAKHPQKKF